MTTALIDADIVAHSNAAAAGEDFNAAMIYIDSMMTNILHATETSSYKAFLTGGNNFRYEINPKYKANRDDLIRPPYLQECREYLVTEWKAKVTDGYEADDALGFNQTEESIICTIDKDLNMIPGKHYTWPIMRGGIEIREAKLYEVSELEGLQAFYRQMLIGDTSDNIFGVKGIGKVKAAKIIDCLQTELEMFEQTQVYYEGDINRFWMNADCLWIMQKEGERYSNRYANKQT